MGIAVESRVADLSSEERSLLLERLPDEARSTQETVTGIIERVQAEGDGALLAMARELDGVELATIEVPRAAWRAALEQLEQDLVSNRIRHSLNVEQGRRRVRGRRLASRHDT